MSSISVIIATYGDVQWEILRDNRAQPSVENNHPSFVTLPDQIIAWHEENGTRVTSLNNAAAEADGDWLIFLDADDELAPGYVGAMRRALEQHGDGPCLFTPAVQQIRKGRPGTPFFFPECSLETGNWLVIGTMISKELFDQIGGFHEHPHGLEDWNLWARAVRAGARIVRVKDAVYRAYPNPRSKHHQLARNKREYMAAYEVARQDAWG